MFSTRHRTAFCAKESVCKRVTVPDRGDRKMTQEGPAKPDSRGWRMRLANCPTPPSRNFSRCALRGRVVCAGEGWKIRSPPLGPVDSGALGDGPKTAGSFWSGAGWRAVWAWRGICPHRVFRVASLPPRNRSDCRCCGRLWGCLVSELVVGLARWRFLKRPGARTHETS